MHPNHTYTDSNSILALEHNPTHSTLCIWPCPEGYLISEFSPYDEKLKVRLRIRPYSDLVDIAKLVVRLLDEGWEIQLESFVWYYQAIEAVDWKRYTIHKEMSEDV